MFLSVSNAESRQMRPETRVVPHEKCPLHRPILTNIRKCERNLVELTNAKFYENPLSSCRFVICR